MSHVADKHFFAGLFFLLLTVFSAVPQSVAITFEAKYMDEQGAGFYHETLGEARRKAFRETLDLFEIWLVGDNTVMVEASFRDDLPPGSLAAGWPARLVYRPSETDPEIWFPIALEESRSGQEINASTEADIRIVFNENTEFYYGSPREFLKLVRGSPGSDIPDVFFLVATHEIIHGLGFTSAVNIKDGSFSFDFELIPSWAVVDGPTINGTPSIYDVNLYSEKDEELLINLSNEQRLEAITSGTGLLWDGMSNGENSYSCAQLIGKYLISGVDQLRPSGGVDSSGRPQLHAPSPPEFASSVGHFHEATRDIMKPSYAHLTFSDLTFGVLRDIGWKLNRNAGDDNYPFNVKDLLVSEVLEECTIATGETASPTPPEQRPVPESEVGGGGCAIAETEGMPQNAIFNLFFVLSVVLFAAVSGNFVIRKTTAVPRKSLGVFPPGQSGRSQAVFPKR